jgi:hypothetical protein
MAAMPKKPDSPVEPPRPANAVNPASLGRKRKAVTAVGSTESKKAHSEQAATSVKAVEVQVARVCTEAARAKAR